MLKKEKLHKFISLLTVFALMLSIFAIALRGRVNAAGVAVTATPNSIAASTATEVTLHFHPSATEYASTNFITVAVSPTLANALANCATATTDADGDTTPDGAFGAFTTSGATYTFTAATTTAVAGGVNLCLSFNTTQTSYGVSITDNGNDGDFGAALLYVGDDNDVNVTANIAPTLSFNIRNVADSSDINVCDLGTVNTATLSPNDDNVVDPGRGECGYGLAVGTNAANGFQVQIASDAALNNATASITNIAENGAITSGTEGYGLDFIQAATTGRNPGTGAYDQPITINGNFNDTTATWDTPVPQAATNFVSYNNGIRYVAGTDASDLTLVIHGIGVGSGTPSGFYDQLVTYTVTANF